MTDNVICYKKYHITGSDTFSNIIDFVVTVSLVSKLISHSTKANVGG